MKLAALLAVAIAATFLTGCAAYRPTGAFGIYFENSFLYSCELRARSAYCGCVLGYMEQNLSEQQVEADFQTGGVTPDIQPGVNACQLAYF
jgi:hypothetical protein